MPYNNKFAEIWIVLLCIGWIHAGRSFNNQQNIQTLLNSIDDRLRNLDKSSTHRHEVAVDQHMRKLQVLEDKIERFEAMVSGRLERVEGNMSVQHFKDDLVQDQLLRKMESVYERMHHRIFHIEWKIDEQERKMTEKLESIVKKLEHLEDTTTTINRRSDAEEEIGEVFDALDELKTTLNNQLENVTRVVQRDLHEIETKLPPRDHLSTRITNVEAILNATRYEQQNAMRGLVVMVGRLGGKNHINNAATTNNNMITSTGDSSAATLGQQLANLTRNVDARFDKLMTQQSIFADSCHRIQSDEPQLESKITEILEKIIDMFEKESAIEIKDIQNIEQLIKSHDTGVRRSLFTTSHNMAVFLQKAKEHKDDLSADVLAVKTAVDQLEQSLNQVPIVQNTITKLLEEIKTQLENQKQQHENQGQNTQNKSTIECGNGIGSQGQVQFLHQLATALQDVIANVTQDYYNNHHHQHHHHQHHQTGESQSPDDQGWSIDKNNIQLIGDALRNVSAKIDALLLLLNASRGQGQGSQQGVEVGEADVEKGREVETGGGGVEGGTGEDENFNLDAAIREVFGNGAETPDLPAISTSSGGHVTNTNNATTTTTTSTTTNTNITNTTSNSDNIIFNDIFINCTSNLLDVRTPQMNATQRNCTICDSLQDIAENPPSGINSTQTNVQIVTNANGDSLEIRDKFGVCCCVPINATTETTTNQTNKTQETEFVIDLRIPNSTDSQSMHANIPLLHLKSNKNRRYVRNNQENGEKLNEE